MAMDTPTKPRFKREVIACGWCKGFVHDEWQDGMYRYVHDEPPATNHEVLPYKVSKAGRQWTSTRR